MTMSLESASSSPLITFASLALVSASRRRMSSTVSPCHSSIQHHAYADVTECTHGIRVSEITCLCARTVVFLMAVECTKFSTRDCSPQ